MFILAPLLRPFWRTMTARARTAIRMQCPACDMPAGAACYVRKAGNRVEAFGFCTERTDEADRALAARSDRR